MEIELARHDWSRLKSLWDSSTLPDAIRALIAATSSETAEAAFWRIYNVSLPDGCLTQSTSAVASCVVQALSSLSPPALVYALDLLSEIADGYVHESPHENLGPITVDECIEEIARAFPFYCEVLENSQDSEARSASVHLIVRCGLGVPDLRQRAKYVLESALRLPDIDPLRRLIASSLDEFQ